METGLVGPSWCLSFCTSDFTEEVEVCCFQLKPNSSVNTCFNHSEVKHQEVQSCTSCRLRRGRTHVIIQTTTCWDVWICEDVLWNLVFVSETLMLTSKVLKDGFDLSWRSSSLREHTAHIGFYRKKAELDFDIRIIEEIVFLYILTSIVIKKCTFNFRNHERCWQEVSTLNQPVAENLRLTLKPHSVRFSGCLLQQKRAPPSRPHSSIGRWRQQ